MYNMDRISFTQINNHFLPKIAREYNIIPEESHSSKVQINMKESSVCPPLISTGMLSTFLSNNNVHVYSSENPPQKKQKEQSSPNYLQLILLGSVTAITTAFGFGRLRSSAIAAEENVWYSRNVIANASNWNGYPNSNDVPRILNIANTYYRAETDRKNKLSNYQNSLFGIAVGVGIGIIGACVIVELLIIIGVIAAVASATFGVYQVAIHWDDFAKAQAELRGHNLTHLIPPSAPPPSAPPPGWRNPPF